MINPRFVCRHRSFQKEGSRTAARETLFPGAREKHSPTKCFSESVPSRRASAKCEAWQDALPLPKEGSCLGSAGNRVSRGRKRSMPQHTSLSPVPSARSPRRAQFTAKRCIIAPLVPKGQLPLLGLRTGFRLSKLGFRFGLRGPYLPDPFVQQLFHSVLGKTDLEQKFHLSI